MWFGGLLILVGLLVADDVGSQAITAAVITGLGSSFLTIQIWFRIRRHVREREGW